MAKNLKDSMRSGLVGVDALIQSTASQEEPKKKDVKENKTTFSNCKVTTLAIDMNLKKFYKNLAINSDCSLQTLINKALMEYAVKNGFTMDE